MIWPSGFKDGTSSSTTLSRRFFVAGSSLVASACAHSIAICVEPISDAWMLQVTSRTTLPSLASLSMSASDNPRVSESFLAVAWIVLMFLWFSSEVMIAMNMSSPRVVLPRTWTLTRGEAFSSARK
jgi:hypothetical protein